MTDWSDIAFDVLEHITSFLPLPDYHRFNAVCKNWRFVAKQKRHSPAPQLPWLVLGDYANFAAYPRTSITLLTFPNCTVDAFGDLRMGGSLP
jgi:F-box domain